MDGLDIPHFQKVCQDLLKAAEEQRDTRLPTLDEDHDVENWVASHIEKAVSVVHSPAFTSSLPQKKREFLQAYPRADDAGVTYDNLAMATALRVERWHIGRKSLWEQRKADRLRAEEEEQRKESERKEAQRREMDERRKMEELRKTEEKKAEKPKEKEEKQKQEKQKREKRKTETERTKVPNRKRAEEGLKTVGEDGARVSKDF